MKVFLSWSGEVSEKAAQALKDWLPNVIQSIEPFQSSEDIRKRQRWSAEIGSQLQDTAFGILCVTPDNVYAPWLNYEAGALSKNLSDSRVIPLAFGMRPGDLPPGPLALFQAASPTEADMLKVVGSLNEVCTPVLPEARLAVIFHKWWPELQEKFDKLADRTKLAPEDGPPQDRATDQLTELLELVRQQSRILSNPTEMLPPPSTFAI